MPTPLTILHLNDLHAHLDQLPRLFTLTRRERERAQAAGRRVLLLDAGDSSDRRQWASAATHGRANYSLLAAMGVQAAVLGNAELSWGRPALARLVQSAAFPVLAANLVDGADSSQPAVPGLLASTRLDLDGFSIGVLGLTQAYPAVYGPAGYGLLDPAAVLRRELGQLRGQGARLVILLSHLGLTRTPFGAASEPPGAWHDDDVAAAFPDLPVIVGAHTHTELHQPQRSLQTVIVQAGCFGQWLGRLDLDVDDAGALNAYSGRLIPCDPTVPRDPTIQGTLELVEEEAQRLGAPKPTAD
ncbi:MAG: metallophosphatase [Anaerolineales bacterium]|nr:metallophosphatase [Anaerolineales bacterium]